MTQLDRTFGRLRRRWLAATRFTSSGTELAAHPSYRAVVALGAPVVPLLLAEMRDRPHHWHAALRELTGADPVAPCDRGRTRAVAAAWVRWGTEQGLLPPLPGPSEVG